MTRSRASAPGPRPSTRARLQARARRRRALKDCATGAKRRVSEDERRDEFRSIVIERAWRERRMEPYCTGRSGVTLIRMSPLAEGRRQSPAAAESDAGRPRK